MEVFQLSAWHEGPYCWLVSEWFEGKPPYLIDDVFAEIENWARFKRLVAELPCPRRYLQDNKDKFKWHEYVIRHGQEFYPDRITSPTFPEPFWHCFQNSYRFAREHGCLYVEGVAVAPTGAYHHAWVSPNGHDVLDLTWPRQDLTKYFGIAFNLDELPENSPEGAFLHYLTLDAGT